MRLNYYIPSGSSSSLILSGGTEVIISGFNSFNFEVDRLIGTYKVWIGTSSPGVRTLLGIGGINNDIINMRNLDINDDAVFNNKSLNVQCHINTLIYNHLKHSYFYFIITYIILFSTIFHFF